MQAGQDKWIFVFKLVAEVTPYGGELASRHVGSDRDL